MNKNNLRGLPMLIFYGDDEQMSRDLVIKALAVRGFYAFALDTSQADQMKSHLKTLCEEQGTPDIFILDGHNILLDKQGNKLYDMTPLGMVSWLRQNGIEASCKFILYSNDDVLVEQARINRGLQFFAAIPKAGVGGGLVALLQAVEHAKNAL